MLLDILNMLQIIIIVIIISHFRSIYYDHLSSDFVYNESVGCSDKLSYGVVATFIIVDLQAIFYK